MSKDYTSLITSEHADKPNFVAALGLVANGVADITAAVQTLLALFDFDTALGQQLDFVGQWIGLSRTVGGVLSVPFFGFADDASALGFTELTNPATGARFVELGEDTSSSATLADPEYRLVLAAKILQNQWDGSQAQFETALADIIQAPITVVDPGVHVVMLRPNELLDPVLTQLLTGYDLIPRAAGVRYQFAFQSASPNAWTTAGTATSPSPTTVQKVSGTNAWNSAAWVAQPAAHIWVQWTVPGTGPAMMAGLAQNPSGSPNFPTLNFGLETAGGGIQVWEAGVQQNGPFPSGNWGSYLPGDSFGVYWDGTNAVYLHNGVPFKVTTPAIANNPGALQAMFALFSVGAEADNINIATA